jgi:hypothetical protein
MTAPENRSPNEVDRQTITPVLSMVYNPATDQIEPSSAGGDATAANQQIAISALEGIANYQGLLALEGTQSHIDSTITTIRGLLEVPRNPFYQTALAVTPDDNTDITTVYNAISVNFDGNVKMQLLNGFAPIIVYLRAGTPYPYSVTRVYATGTTATGITVWR